LRFEILTPRPIEMKVGTRIDYRLRVLGLSVRWQSEITAWQPPHRFVDEQRRGPYRLWHHEHTFTEQDGGTLVGDHVQYAVLGGALVERLFVRRDITAIFAYRQQKLAALFN
jgi:ligand-binding SRPBCC domain-containing protein